MGDAAESLLHDGRETRLTLALRRARFWFSILIAVGLLVSLVGQMAGFGLAARIGALLVVTSFPPAVAVIFARWLLLVLRAGSSSGASRLLQPTRAAEVFGEREASRFDPHG